MLTVAEPRIPRRPQLSHVRAIEDELYPMAELPEEWKTGAGATGSPAPQAITAP